MKDKLIEDIGELGFFDLLKKYFSHLDITDDAAILSAISGNEATVTSVDMLVENNHFDLKKSTYYQVAFKALASNVSDIYAMGAKPREYFLSIAIPAETKLADIEDFLLGLSDASKWFEVNLLGGDTTSSKQGLCISISINGVVDKNQVVKRSGAKTGDVVYLAKEIGKNAFKGYQIEIDDLKSIKFHGLDDLIKSRKINSMADISDGLARSLYDLSYASNCGFEVDLSNLYFVEKYGLNNVLHGGDDYVLIFTVAAKNIQDVPKDCIKIGEVVSGKDINIYCNKEKVKLDKVGYQHFDPPLSVTS